MIARSCSSHVIAMACVVMPASRSVTGCPATDTVLPLYLFQQVGNIGGNEINHGPVECLGSGDRHALAYRLLGPGGVTPIGGSERADQRRGVLGGLGQRCRFGSRPVLTKRHRMGGADVGAGCHRCHVGGERHKQAGGRGARAGRGHVDNRRDLGAQQALGDVPHGALEAAGRIEPDEQPRRLVALGQADGAAEVLGGNRRDGAVNLGCVEHPLGLRRRAGRLCRRRDSGEAGRSEAAAQPDQQEQHIQQATRRAANHRTIPRPRHLVVAGAASSEDTPRTVVLAIGGEAGIACGAAAGMRRPCAHYPAATGSGADAGAAVPTSTSG